MALTKLLRDTGLAERATVHGFRSSFRDWCAETGQPRELAEAALAHTRFPGVEGAYFRERSVRAPPPPHGRLGPIPHRRRRHRRCNSCHERTPLFAKNLHRRSQALRHEQALEQVPIIRGHILQQRSSFGIRTGVKLSVASPMASQSSGRVRAARALEGGLELGEGHLDRVEVGLKSGE